jgi:hypothetical protein
MLHEELQSMNKMTLRNYGYARNPRNKLCGELHRGRKHHGTENEIGLYTTLSRFLNSTKYFRFSC